MVVFEWNGTPAAIPAESVITFLHDAAIAPLPVRFGKLTKMIAYDSDLFPLIDDPEFRDFAELEYTTVIVTHNEHGNLAIRVGNDVDLEMCSVESDSFVSIGDGRTAMLLDTAEILEIHLPEGSR